MLVDPDERERWEAAARADGRSLAAWLRRLANAAAPGLVLVEYNPPDEAAAEELRRLATKINEEGTGVGHAMLPAAKKPSGQKPPLCGRCARIGQPSCEVCRKAWGLA